MIKVAVMITEHRPRLNGSGAARYGCRALLGDPLNCPAPGKRFSGQVRRRLEVARAELDLTVFADLTALGRKALAADDLPAARDHLAQAVLLWRGDLCEGLPGYPELQIERVYWEEVRLLATESLLAAKLGLGEHGETPAELRRLIAEHPLREELRGMLMVSLYRCHRRSDALDVFSDTRTLLVTEFGIEPGPYLQRLQRAILLDDRTLVSGLALGSDHTSAAASRPDPAARTWPPSQPAWSWDVTPAQTT